MDIEKLKALALAATQGKWEAAFPIANGAPIREANCQVSVDGCLIANVSHGPIYPAEPFGSAMREANANYIAAACPAAVLELIAEVDRLRKGRT